MTWMKHVSKKRWRSHSPISGLAMAVTIREKTTIKNVYKKKRKMRASIRPQFLLGKALWIAQILRGTTLIPQSREAPHTFIMSISTLLRWYQLKRKGLRIPIWSRGKTSSGHFHTQISWFLDIHWATQALYWKLGYEISCCICEVAVWKEKKGTSTTKDIMMMGWVNVFCDATNINEV